MQELVKTLNYYNECYEKGNPIVSDKVYDDLYFELLAKEKEAGYALADSPTQTLKFPVVSELKKVKHAYPMLSLAKTKDDEEVRKFIGNEETIVMGKMDGLTCSLTYSEGRLIKAETRGDGFEGEDILHNARVISSIPKIIDYTEDLIVEGEIVSTFKNFSQFAKEYKNPRNFAAGSIRLLDPFECSRRKLTFVAWEVKEGLNDINYLSSRLNKIETFGFTIVPFAMAASGNFNFDEVTEKILDEMSGCGFPLDGLVFKFNNIEYGNSLGRTSHHFKNAIAYKFYDETYPTVLKAIEWTMGRTGTLTPVAVFEPIEIDGTMVERANLHNINVLRDTLGDLPHKGQKIEVYKANMIIPQIYSADKERKESPYYIANTIFNVPNLCPFCQGSAKIVVSDGNTQVLVCQNPECDTKLINKLDHFCSKKGLDIKGLSKATLETLIEKGWVSSCLDLFGLESHKDEWIATAGFGKKSVENALAAIEKAKNTTFVNFISALSIPLIGVNVAKELNKYFFTYEEFREKVNSKFDFGQFNGFAENKTNSILNFDYTEADKIYKLLNISEAKNEMVEESELKDKTIVITGKLTEFKNREEFQEKIVSLGGKVSGSVSSKTFCLINNDINSNSSKNKTAKSLNIPIYTEKEFIEKYLTF